MCYVPCVKEVPTYKYEKGKLKCVTSSSSEEAAEYEYAAGNLTVATLPGSGTYTYTYQSTGNTHLASSVTCDTLTTSFAYNGAGLNTESVLSSTENTSGKTIRSTAEYTSDSHHVTKTTDVNGFDSATATYNSKNQMSQSTAIPSDTSGSTGTVATVYTYDSAGRATSSYISGTISLGNRYEGGRIKWINRGGYISGNSEKQSQAYSFTYDIWGNTTSTNVGYIDTKGTSDTSDDEFIGNDLATYEYASKNGNLISMTYGNGAVVEYTYDMFDRIRTETHKDIGPSNALDVLYINTYYYNGDGSLARVEKTVDNSIESIIYYTYDGIGRVLEVCEYEGDTLVNKLSYGYDDINRTNKATVQAGTNEVTSTYTYDDTDGKVTHLDNVYNVSDISGTHGFDYSYDYLKRLTSKELTTSVGSDLTVSYGYANNQSNSTYASTFVSSLCYKVSQSDEIAYRFDYTYDNIGNIKSVFNTGLFNDSASGTVNYVYDNQNQLVLEENRIVGETYLYEYDTYGNIRKKYTIDDVNISSVSSAQTVIAEGMTPHTEEVYTYGNSEWKDQLTAYKGINFTYDEIGNPLVYYNGDSYAFTWQNGRQLVRAEVNDEPVTFTYDTDGQRTSKTLSNGNVYDFYYVGDILVCQTWYEGQCQLNFLYDESGNVYGFVYNDGLYTAPYYYVKNIQGDVVAILNASNAVVAEYAYDAWGNILSVTDGNGNAVTPNADHIANINPIRYRSYYYDTETMFYYLQSRYYDPYLGRFINADGYMSTGQGFLNYNMYTYCFNNPINGVDISGDIAGWVIAMIAGGVIGGLTSAICTNATGGSFGETAISFLEGAVVGAISSYSTAGMILGIVFDAALVINDCINSGCDFNETASVVTTQLVFSVFGAKINGFAEIFYDVGTGLISEGLENVVFDSNTDNNVSTTNNNVSAKNSISTNNITSTSNTNVISIDGSGSHTPSPNTGTNSFNSCSRGFTNQNKIIVPITHTGMIR